MFKKCVAIHIRSVCVSTFYMEAVSIKLHFHDLSKLVSALPSGLLQLSQLPARSLKLNYDVF